jgi:hypothetical protein
MIQRYNGELNNNDNVKFEDIIFHQNSQSFDGFNGSGGIDIDGFFESDEKEMISFLSQWDNGDSMPNNNHPGYGTNDKVFLDTKNNYLLTYNFNLGYASLQRIIFD